MRWLCALVATSFLLPPTAAVAQEEPDIEFFYPVVTRRPVIERELELRVKHEKGRDGRETEMAAAIELPLLPRWQIELEVPVVITDPRDGTSAAGFGDLAVENKFLLWKSVEHRALVAAGFELTLPSGSERRGLGGEFAVEPRLGGHRPRPFRPARQCRLRVEPQQPRRGPAGAGAHGEPRPGLPGVTVAHAVPRARQRDA